MYLFVERCFFFQAEDGIRDCLLSRGLGDVYKRQAQAVGIRAVGVFDPFYASYEAEMRGFCDRYITSFTELL